MAPRSTVAARLVKPLLALGQEALSRYDLSQIDFDDPEARVDYEVLLALMQSAEQLTGDASVGLAGAVLDAGTLQVFDFMSRSSLHVLDALQRCARYQALLHESCVFRIETTNETSTLVVGIRGGLPFPRQVAEFFMASLFQSLYRLQVEPVGLVQFAHAPPADMRPYESFFRVPVAFGAARHSAVFPTAALLKPLPQPDPALAASLERHAAEMLERIPRSDGLGERVRAALLHALPSGEPSLAHIAKTLHMSERTLRRRLAADGLSYKILLDQLRSGLALRYMQQPDMDAERLAFLLGFAEASSLRRAFKRWTGGSVAEFRARASAVSS